MNGSKWRGWLLAILIFSLGAAVGGSAVTLLGIRFLRRTFQSPVANRGLADLAARRVGEDLADALKLTPEQTAQVQSILNDSATQLKTIRAQAALQVAAELRGSTERIASALPPEKHDELYRVIGKRYERLGLTPPPTPADR